MTEKSAITSPELLKRQYVLSEEDNSFIDQTRKSIQNILTGQDSRKFFIIGPCSIHHETSALEFAQHLKQLQSDYPQYLFIMRMHMEKPRSSIGWRGFAYDPDLDGSCNIEKGIRHSRKLLTLAAQYKVPITAELLDPFLYPYFADCYSMANIGSRTLCSQPHRQIASMSPFPIGLKNSLDGDIDDILSAQQMIENPHTFLASNNHGITTAVKSKGNPFTFPILRGGKVKSNIDLFYLETFRKKYESCNRSFSFVIDCGHGNSQKNILKQKENLLYSLELATDSEYDLKGIMMETHLMEGSQAFSGPIHPYCSITDPCISIKSLRDVIEQFQGTNAAMKSQ